MKKDESKVIEILREEVRSVPADDTAVEESLREALRVFRKSGPETRAAGSDHGWRAFRRGALSAGAIAVAVVVAVAAFGWWLKPAPISTGPNAEALARLLSEIEVLFPSQVAAVVMNREEIDIQLTGAPAALARPSDQRIRMTFGRDGRTITVLTYSGQEVELKLNGTVVSVAPLIQADGAVFLLTDDAVIRPPRKSRIAGYEITLARLSPPILSAEKRS